MANNCFYMMHVKGKKENVDEFCTELRDYDHIPHFWRVFSADTVELESFGDGTVVVEIVGDCAWSVYTCMTDISGSYAKRWPEGSTSLRKESERLGLEIEVFSEESGIGFQEHYRYDHGKELAAEEAEWSVYMFEQDEYDPKNREKAFELFLDDIGLTDRGFTIDSLREDGILAIGGFRNYGDFSF